MIAEIKSMCFCLISHNYQLISHFETQARIKNILNSRSLLFWENYEKMLKF